MSSETVDKPIETKKVKRSFKEYYADPKFKARHDEYVKGKTVCKCGATVARYNLSNHKKTARCIAKCKALQNQAEIDFKEALEIALKIVEEKRKSK